MQKVHYWSIGYNKNDYLIPFPILKWHKKQGRFVGIWEPENIIDAATNRGVVVYLADDEMMNRRENDDILKFAGWFLNKRMVQAPDANASNAAIRYINYYHKALEDRAKRILDQEKPTPIKLPIVQPKDMIKRAVNHGLMEQIYNVQMMAQTKSHLS